MTRMMLVMRLVQFLTRPIARETKPKQLVALGEVAAIEDIGCAYAVALV